VALGKKALSRLRRPKVAVIDIDHLRLSFVQYLHAISQAFDGKTAWVSVDEGLVDSGDLGEWQCGGPHGAASECVTPVAIEATVAACRDGVHADQPTAFVLKLELYELGAQTRFRARNTTQTSYFWVPMGTEKRAISSLSWNRQYG
jgi:hypothetical protein